MLVPSPAKQRWLPFLAWWPRVTRQTLKDDAVAGLIGAVVVLPQGVAFAAIAGMPPVYGLYAGIVPAIVAALFGSSWHLVSGPTTAASIVLFSVLSPHASPGSAEYIQLAVTLTFLVGFLELGLGVARLGNLVNFISHSVVLGFTAGAALLIAISQLKNFTGIPVPQGSSFVTTVSFVVQHSGDASIPTILAGLATLAAGIATRVWLRRVPYMLVGLVVGGLTATGLQLIPGWEGAIPAMGSIPASLPPLSLPSPNLENLHVLASGVLAVGLLALTEAVSIGRALALRSGQAFDGNQEFIGQGLSNVVGSFFSAYVATGSFNRSAINYEAGAKTPLAALMGGFFLMFCIFGVAPLLTFLPHAAMAGVLFLVAHGIIDFPHIFHLLRTSRQEGAILIVTFLGTLLSTLESAILAGVLLSLVLYLHRTSHPQVVERLPDARHPRRHFVAPGPGDPRCPQLAISRLDGSLFFGAVSAVRERWQEPSSHGPQPHLMVVATGINFIDLAGADLMVEESRRRRQMGGSLSFVRMKDEVLGVLENSGYLESLGRESFFSSRGDAIRTLFSRLDHDYCSQCSLHVFRECTLVNKRENQQGGPVEMIISKVA
ncbi:MAG: SulP family inorganic anion transporter [Magnetococcales bacterium]|nr:SulP family inorganic anion transporter [Magnetococcales bacterium]MBF0157544.1 SulP family inorganic anion transporter [Magnetococcales bacterium]